jgi:beta-galactosidase
MCTADFNVNLVYQPTLSFSSFKLETPVQKDLKNANLKVQANFYNPDDTRQATVHLTLKDPNGKKVAEQTVTDVLPLGEVRLFDIVVKSPLLWSPEQPQLYTCEFTLKTTEGEQTVTEQIGFRHFEFVDYGPFKLNGKRLLLKGTMPA